MDNPRALEFRSYFQGVAIESRGHTTHILNSAVNLEATFCVKRSAIIQSVVVGTKFMGDSPTRIGVTSHPYELT